MHQMLRPGSVVVSALASQTEHSGLIRAGHAWHIRYIVLQSNFSAKLFCFFLEPYN